MMLTQGISRVLREKSVKITLSLSSTINPKCIGLGVNLGPVSERPMTDCLSHDSMAQGYYTIYSIGRRPSNNLRQ
jgi:hypothetical protein